MKPAVPLLIQFFFALASMVAFLVAIPLLGGIGVARAQEHTAKIGPKASFHQGLRAYDRGDYEQAMRHFWRAYEASGNADVLFNVGKSAERLGREKEAITAYKRYLTESESAQDAAEVKQRIRVLKNKRRQERFRQRVGRSAVKVDDVLGWGAIGIGGAVALTGLILIGTGVADKIAVEGAPQGAAWSDFEMQRSRGNTALVIGPILTIVGAVGIGAGWWILDEQRRRERRLPLENGVVKPVALKETSAISSLQLVLGGSSLSLKGRF